MTSGNKMNYRCSPMLGAARNNRLKTGNVSKFTAARIQNTARKPRSSLNAVAAPSATAEPRFEMPIMMANIEAAMRPSAMSMARAKKTVS